MATKREREKRKYSNTREVIKKMATGNVSTSVRMPEGMSWFFVKVAKPIKIDILPYDVKKGRDQKGGNPNCDSGLSHWERTYFAHRAIGAEQTSVCCLRKTFGKKCPICEAQATMRRDPYADDDIIKGLEPKKRQLFIVRDLADEESGLKLWDVSPFLFGDMLVAKLDAAEEEDGYEDFFSLETGKSLKVGFSEEHMGKNAFFKCNNIEMRPRKPLPESLWDEVPDLDSLLVELTYDKLKVYYDQTENEDSVETEKEDDIDADDDPKPAKAKPPAKNVDDEEIDPPSSPLKKKLGRPAKKVKEPEPEEDETEDEDPEDEEEIEVGDMVQHDDFGECEVIALVDGGKKLNLKDSDGKVKKNVWANDVTPLEEEEEEEVAPPKDFRTDARAKKEEDEEDDDWEEEEEKPAKKPAKKK